MYLWCLRTVGLLFVLDKQESGDTQSLFRELQIVDRLIGTTQLACHVVKRLLLCLEKLTETVAAKDKLTAQSTG